MLGVTTLGAVYFTFNFHFSNTKFFITDLCTKLFEVFGIYYFHTLNIYDGVISDFILKEDICLPSENVYLAVYSFQHLKVNVDFLLNLTQLLRFILSTESPPSIVRESNQYWKSNQYRESNQDRHLDQLIYGMFKLFV